MTRTLSSSTAAVVERLELEQAFLVSLDDLRSLLNEAGVRSEPSLVAKRLRDRGWLLPTAVPGVWEFAPAAQAGPYSQGHPFRDVIASNHAHPHLHACVCLTSALWAHGLSDRLPDRPEVSVPPGVHVPIGLARTFRVARFEANAPVVTLRQTPTHALPTVLVHFAARPADVTSWGTVLDLLPDLVGAIAQQANGGGLAALEAELRDRPASVRTRLAYLLHGVAPAWARALQPTRHARGKVWFGPRGPLRRHHAPLEIADTILPMSPGELPPLEDLACTRSTSV